MSGIGSISGIRGADTFIGHYHPSGYMALAGKGAGATYCAYFTVNAPHVVTLGAFLIGVSAGNIDIGILDGDTGAMLSHSGSTASPGTGGRTMNLLTPVRLVPGKRYITSFACDSAILTTMDAIGSQTGFNPPLTIVGYYTAYPVASHALPITNVSPSMPVVFWTPL